MKSYMIAMCCAPRPLAGRNCFLSAANHSIFFVYGTVRSFDSRLFSGPLRHNYGVQIKEPERLWMTASVGESGHTTQNTAKGHDEH